MSLSTDKRCEEVSLAGSFSSDLYIIIWTLPFRKDRPRFHPCHTDSQRGLVASAVRLAVSGQRQFGTDLHVGGEQRGRRSDQREELLRRGRARPRSPPPATALERARRIRQPRNESLEELLRQFSRIEERLLLEELQNIAIH